MTAPALEEAANEAKRRVLDLVIKGGERLVLVDSPPGAGKTDLVEDVVAVAIQEGVTVVVATPRVEQTTDLAMRLTEHFRALTVQLFASETRPLPVEVAQHPRILVVHSQGQLRRDIPAIATVAKLKATTFGPSLEWDLLVCDEAYQVTYADFSPLTTLAGQYLLVGDPGQLAPLVQSNPAQFEAAEARVHWPAPAELRRKFATVPIVRLPVTRRFAQSTVDVIQPALYPHLPFASAVEPESRRLLIPVAGTGSRLDRGLNGLAEGASLIAFCLPEQSELSNDDPELSALAAEAMVRLQQRGAEWAGQGALTDSDFGYADMHVASGHTTAVSMRRAGINTAAAKSLTPEVWQGLQRPVMVVKHPLSGLRTASRFALDPGRLCVMLSRHRLACIIVTRDGVRSRLEEHVFDSSERAMGAADEEWSGWQAHHSIWNNLESAGLVFRL